MLVGLLLTLQGPPPPLLWHPASSQDHGQNLTAERRVIGLSSPSDTGISTSSGQTSQQAAKGGLTLERKKVTTKSKKTTSRRGPTASLTRGLEDVCIASDDSMPSLVSDDGDDDVEPSAEAPPGDSKGDVDEAAWSVAKLKKELASLGRSSRGLTEKAELVAVVRQARRAQRAKQMEGGAPPAKG